MDDFTENLEYYVGKPTNQVNLGWSVISVFYIGSVVLGLLLLVILGMIVLFRTPGDLTKELYLAYIGIALIIFGFYQTKNNFNSIFKAIEVDIIRKGDKSLFQKDTAKNALVLAALNSNEIFQARIEKTRSFLEESLNSENGGDENLLSAIKNFEKNGFGATKRPGQDQYRGLRGLLPGQAPRPAYQAPGQGLLGQAHYGQAHYGQAQAGPFQNREQRWSEPNEADQKQLAEAFKSLLGQK